MLIKIYGERNTGTNYLEQLLRKHIPALNSQRQDELCIASASILLCKQKDLEQLGWKHRLVDMSFLQSLYIEKKNVLMITATKNPYSWLLSLHKRPYAPIHLRNRVISLDESGIPCPHTDRNIKIIRKFRKYGRWGRIFLSYYPQWSEYEEIDFSDFIRAKWFTQFNEGCDKGFKNPIQLWNVKNKAYLELAKNYNVISLTYEELLTSPKKTMERIAERLGGTIKNFENVHAAAKNEDKEKNYQFYQDYYLNERWKNQLTQKDIAWISSQLDRDVMKAYGYEIL